MGPILRSSDALRLAVVARACVALVVALLLIKAGANKATAVAAATPGLSLADFRDPPRVVLQDDAGRELGDTPLFSAAQLLPGAQIVRCIVARNEGTAPATLSVQLRGADNGSPLLAHPHGLQAALVEMGSGGDGTVRYHGPLRRLGTAGALPLPPRSATTLRLSVSLPPEAPNGLAEQQLVIAFAFVVAQAR